MIRLASMLLIVLLTIQTAAAQTLPSFSMSGGIDPGYVGAEAIVSVGLHGIKPEEYNDINKIIITIDPFLYQDNKYLMVAEGKLTNVYLSVYRPGENNPDFNGQPLIEGQDYIKNINKEYKSSGVGEVAYDLIAVQLLKKDKLLNGGYLQFFFEKYKMLEQGNIHISVRFYKNIEDVEPIRNGNIDLPIMNKIINPSPSLAPGYFVILNSASGKTCDNLCQEKSAKCDAISSNTEIEDGNYVSSHGSQCGILRGFGCRQVMRSDKQEKCYGETNITEWTYCHCKSDNLSVSIAPSSPILTATSKPLVPSPSISPNEEKEVGNKLRELKQQINELKKQQSVTTQELKEQRNIIQSILNIIKRVFGNFFKQ